MISGFHRDGHVPTEVAACLAVFFDEMKHNKITQGNESIVVRYSDELPMQSDWITYSIA